MQTIQKLEEFALFAGGITLLITQTSLAWYLLLIYLLLPDLSMIGYLINERWGAHIYNIFHNRLIGLMGIGIGWWVELPWLWIAGLILLTHVSMDRMLGIGLKYPDHFKHTHLGWIGNQDEKT
jgi:hypothetical protein